MLSLNVFKIVQGALYALAKPLSVQGLVGANLLEFTFQVNYCLFRPPRIVLPCPKLRLVLAILR